MMTQDKSVDPFTTRVQTYLSKTTMSKFLNKKCFNYHICFMIIISPNTPSAVGYKSRKPEGIGAPPPPSRGGGSPGDDAPGGGG